jgi:hypothetical protein
VAKVDIRSRDRLEAALRSGDLKEFVDRLRLDGLSQAAIYLVFEAFLLELRATGREADEDAILDSMDYIWGCCAPGQEWFESTLTEAEVQVGRAESDLKRR